jgi:hypothetical protein
MKKEPIGCPETSENLHILTRLFTTENFIEFCRCESFKDLNFAVFNRHLSFTADEIVKVLSHQPWSRGEGMQV